MRILILRILLLGVISATLGCGYRLGYGQRSLPGKYRRIAIPVFKNLTQEVGIEPYFTNALIRQFSRSKVARLTPKSLSPVVLEGQVIEVSFDHSVQKSSDALENLPQNAVLTTQYRMKVMIRMLLKRASDGKIIWQEVFTKEKAYSAPQIASDTINSANPLYNQSAKHENIKVVAADMMVEAHDRLTERF